MKIILANPNANKGKHPIKPLMPKEQPANEPPSHGLPQIPHI